jgi:hypothetical protein
LSLAKKKVIDKEDISAPNSLLEPTSVVENINQLMTQIQTFLNNSRDIIISKYGGFMSIWDNYNNKL